MSHILIVDDDADFRALAVRTLEARGHRLTQADTGRRALACIAEQAPDLIVVDGLLPDCSGIAWIEQRRQSGDHTPILFVSSFWRDLEALQQLTSKLAVTAVLRKPVYSLALADAVEASLQPTSSAARPADDPAEAHSVLADDWLADLRVAYLAALQAKVDALCVLVDRVKVYPDDLEAVGAGREGAHRLAGTAGSYGCPAVGTAAAAIEELMLRAASAGVVTSFAWARAAADLRRAAAAVIPAEPAEPAEPPARRSRNLSLHRVLLVDDDPEFLTAVEAAGRSRGIAVTGVTGAATALARAAVESFDAAIIDVRLGAAGGDSFQLARDLRALPGRADLPLAFVSAHGEVADRVAAAHAGATLFLSKPVDAHGLSTAIHVLTSARRTTRPRLLIIDDDPAFIDYAAGVLGAEMDVTAAIDAACVLDLLEECNPDVILVDAMMTGVSGFDLCRTIRAMPRWQQVSILFATASQCPDARLDAFRAGADDYLSKPVLREELLARVQVRVERSRLLRDRLENDALTGLPLRRVFLEQLAARMGEARRRKRAISLVLLDVDQFKAINDRHGHLAGDRVLADLGRLLQRRFRAEDLRARWGGEEFALAFVEETPETVAIILERVLTEFTTLSFTGAGGESFRCTFSAGVAGWPEDGDQLDTLLSIADARLYAAKAAGRNRVVCTPAAVVPCAHGADRAAAAGGRRAG